MSHGPVPAADAGVTHMTMVTMVASTASTDAATAAGEHLRPARRTDEDRMFCSLAEGPLLVGLAVAGPQLHQGTVRGSTAGHIQAQPRLHARDRATRFPPPLLVRRTVTRPGLHLRPRRRLIGIRVQAQRRPTTADRQLTRRRQRPGLVRTTRAVIDLQLNTRRRTRIRHIQTPARPHRTQRTTTGAGATAGSVTGGRDAALHRVLGRVGGVALRDGALEELADTADAVAPPGAQQE